MKEINSHLAEIDKRLIHFQASLEQMAERQNALHLVTGWLLAMQPGNEVLRFLSGQANELEGSQKFVEQVALLDELREDVRAWLAQWKGGHTSPR